MGRTLTLRGSIEHIIQSPRSTEKLIFNYESPDRTKGWKVKGAWLWLSPLGNTITANCNPLIIGALGTDSILDGGPGVSINKLASADDNRLFGWTQIHYRGFDAQDYMVPHASTPSDQSFLLDLNRIVTNELYLSVNGLANNGLTGPWTGTFNYMIALEEVKISPTQSILQQLKGIGQNIDN